MSVHMATLGDVVEIKGGGTPSKANSSFWTGDIPWISPKDMKRWEIDDAEDKITSEAINKSATNLVPSNSILVVNRSGILKHTLPVGITRRPVAINQDIKALICNGCAHPEYVAHMVKAAEPIVLKWVRATTADNFSIENLRSLQIPLPPFDEQQRIAAILDKADALCRKRKQTLDLLQELTLGLVSKYLDDRRTRASIELGEIITDGPTNGLYKPSTDYGDGVPIVRIDSFYDGKIVNTPLKRLRVTETEMTRFQLRVGDLVINRVNSLEYLGKSAIVDKISEPTVFESNMMKFAVDSSILLPEVCIALLQTPEVKGQILRKAKKAVNQASINQGDVKSLRLPLPAMIDQNKFLAGASKIESLRAKAMKDEGALSSLFSSLQHRAFSGQL